MEMNSLANKFHGAFEVFEFANDRWIAKSSDLQCVSRQYPSLRQAIQYAFDNGATVIFHVATEP